MSAASARRTRLLLLALFLFSGVSGLVYQVVWTRMFALVLGTTVYSVSTVLGVFMGGLALGSFLFGRIVDGPTRTGPSRNGLRLYGWLELGIGVYAFALPFLMMLCDAIYRSVWPAVADSGAGALSVRLLLAGLVLLLPTTLMGGTLPALSKHLVRSPRGTGVEIGTLYAINTLGALAGCFVTGFFLLEWFGVRATLFTAGFINLAVGGFALRVARRAEEPVPEEPVPKEPVQDAADARTPSDDGVEEPAFVCTPRQRNIVLGVFAVSGLASLALEVLWTRALMYFVSVDTWAFTSMLCAFLLGIGVGSFVMARLLSRIREPLRALATVEVLIGVTAGLSIPLLRHLYGISTGIGRDSFAGLIAGKLLSSFSIMLIPALLMGAAFPLVSRIYVGSALADPGSKRRVGGTTGTLYAWNTIGAIAGSLSAGFLLIPWLGIERSIVLMAALYVSLGLLLFATAKAKSKATAAWRAGALLGVVGLLVFVGVFEGTPVVEHSRYLYPGSALHKAEGWKLVYHRENADASIAVIENRNGTRALNINGVVTAADNYLDMQVHRMLSHLPIAIHPKPKKVLIVGFGMGSTVWGSCQHDLKVDVVELLREEKNTAKYFEKINHGVLDPVHERLTFIQGDGRNYLFATDTRYDVISFNAIHPRFSANLYTRDFYAMCRERMTDDGVICAWMTQNSMTDGEWRMLCRSFVDVFPESSMWYCNPEHFCLIGQKSAGPIDFARWKSLFVQSAVQADLRDSNLEDPEVMLSRFMFGGAALRDYVAGALLNTDDHPRIEFSLERKDDERPIIEAMVARQEDVRPYVTGLSAAEQERMERRRRASFHLMRGQIDFWYPSTSNPARSRAISQTEHLRALRMFPENEDIRRNLLAHSARRRALEARIAADPKDPVAQRELGVIAMTLGDLPRARKWLLGANAARPDDPATLRALGLTHLFLGEHGRAGGAFNRLFAVLKFQMHAGNALEQYAAGVALQKLGHAQGGQWKAKALEALPEAQRWFDELQACARRK